MSDPAGTLDLLEYRRLVSEMYAAAAEAHPGRVPAGAARQLAVDELRAGERP